MGIPPLMRILQSFPPARAIQTALAVLLVVCAFFSTCMSFSNPRASPQAAKGVTNHDELADLLELIEHLLKPLEIYAQITHTPAMDETAVKIIVELLSTLAVTTKELNQGRSSESVLLDMLH